MYEGYKKWLNASRIQLVGNIVSVFAAAIISICKFRFVSVELLIPRYLVCSFVRIQGYEISNDGVVHCLLASWLILILSTLLYNK